MEAVLYGICMVYDVDAILNSFKFEVERYYIYDIRLYAHASARKEGTFELRNLVNHRDVMLTSNTTSFFWSRLGSVVYARRQYVYSVSQFRIVRLTRIALEILMLVRTQNPDLTMSASNSWRNPPAAIQVKYNLTTLPPNFVPTAQEQELLEMYETIKQYEKESARLKEEAARAKLEAAAAKYDEARHPASKKRKKKKRPVDDHLMEDLENQHGEEADDDDRSDADNADDDEEDLPVSLAERRAAKLAEWKEDAEDFRKEERQQEEMREKLLGNDQLGPDMQDVQITKRKRRDSETEEGKGDSLIGNIAQGTPPHDFSKKLDIKSLDGIVLFPNKDHTSHVWNPPVTASNPNDEALVFELDGFDVSKSNTGHANNTIAIKFMAPAESKRFSVNIAGPNHREYDSVVFHFNPRQFEKGGQLVLNNKQEGMWGQAVNVPLSRVPKIFGETSSSVIIQIHGDGFDVFIDGKHCARLEHREEIRSDGKLYLQFPATDDRGQVENWSLYKVWWGRKKLMAKDDLADVYGVNAYIGMHPKKLFIRGLAPIQSEIEIDLRRAQLERAFRNYGGDRGVTVTIPTQATFAFVECETEQLAHRALEEMSGEYDIKRARRSRMEALIDERAAAAGKTGKDSTEWD